jgi:hypothetical protein
MGEGGEEEGGRGEIKWEGRDVERKRGVGGCRKRA